MALSISVGINERAAVEGAKKIGKSLEDVDKKLDDLAKGSGGFDELAKDADRAGDKIGTSMDRGFKKAKAGAEDFKQEANQTARESAASFDGSAESIGDAFQEVAANAFSGFGPLGAAAGIAAAVGFGAVTAEITKQQEEAKKLGEFFATAYQTAATEGRKYLDAATIIGEAQDIIFNPDRQSEYNRLQEEANTIGLSAQQLVLARAGDQEALNVVLAATAAKQDELKVKAEEAGSTAIRLSQDEQRELEKLQGDYQEIGALHDANREKLKTSEQVVAEVEQKSRDQIQRTKDAAQSRYEALASQYARAIEGKVTFTVDDTAVRNYRVPDKFMTVYPKLGGGSLDWDG